MNNHGSRARKMAGQFALVTGLALTGCAMAEDGATQNNKPSTDRMIGLATLVLSGAGCAFGAVAFRHARKAQQQFQNAQTFFGNVIEGLEQKQEQERDALKAKLERYGRVGEHMQEAAKRAIVVVDGKLAASFPEGTEEGRWEMRAALVTIGKVGKELSELAQQDQHSNQKPAPTPPRQ